MALSAKFLPSFVLLGLCTFLTAASSLADFYKYTDRNGVFTITDNLDSVPKRYRSAMR